MSRGSRAATQGCGMREGTGKSAGVRCHADHGLRCRCDVGIGATAGSAVLTRIANRWRKRDWRPPSTSTNVARHCPWRRQLALHQDVGHPCSKAGGQIGDR